MGEFPLAQLAQLAELCRDETAELILLRPEDAARAEAGEQTHLGWKEAAERIGVERQQCDAGDRAQLWGDGATEIVLAEPNLGAELVRWNRAADGVPHEREFCERRPNGAELGRDRAAQLVVGCIELLDVAQVT